jgi:hypothetical protein
MLRAIDSNNKSFFLNRSILPAPCPQSARMGALGCGLRDHHPGRLTLYFQGFRPIIKMAGPNDFIIFLPAHKAPKIPAILAMG